MTLSRYGRPRGIAEAATLLGGGAVGCAVAAVLLLLAGLLGALGAGAIGGAIGTAVMSWLLAVAGALTALAGLRRDRTDRRARTALMVAAPGAALGTVAILVAAVLLAAPTVSAGG